MLKSILVAALIPFAGSAFASTQTISCKAPNEEFSFTIRDANQTFADTNDCFNSASASCKKFRKLVTGDTVYDKIVSLDPAPELGYRLHARGMESESVTLFIPGDYVNKAGSFKSHSEMCASDCVKVTYSCTSTIN